MSFRELGVQWFATWLVYSLNCYQFPWPTNILCFYIFTFPNQEFLSQPCWDSGEAWENEAKTFASKDKDTGPVGCFNPPFYLILLNLEENRCWIRKGIRVGWLLGFWPCHAACGILAPWPGVKPVPLQWKLRVLPTGPPGNSLGITFWVERPLTNLAEKTDFRGTRFQWVSCPQPLTHPPCQLLLRCSLPRPSCPSLSPCPQARLSPLSAHTSPPLPKEIFSALTAQI